MTRPALATLALVGLSLALPHTAAAEEAMCGLRSTVVVLEASELEAALTPEVFGAFSAAEVAPPATPSDSGEILWCASSNDPRCAPAHTGTGGTVELRGGGAVFVLPSAYPPIADSPASTLRVASQRARSRSGVRRSLDRPPR